MTKLGNLQAYLLLFSALCAPLTFSCSNSGGEWNSDDDTEAYIENEKDKISGDDEENLFSDGEFEIASDDVKQNVTKASSLLAYARSFLEGKLQTEDRISAVSSLINLLEQTEGISSITPKEDNGAIFFSFGGIRLGIYIDRMDSGSTAQTLKTLSKVAANANDLEEKRKFALFAPFAGDDNAPSVNGAIALKFESSGFDATLYADDDATPKSLEQMGEFDAIYIRSHSSIDDGLFNFMVATEPADDAYVEYLQSGKMGIGAVVGDDKNRYTIYPSFFQSVPFRERSIVYLSANSGSYNDSLSSALIKNGLNIYMGWTDVLNAKEEESFTAMPFFNRALLGGKFGAVIKALQSEDSRFGHTYLKSWRGTIHSKLKIYLSEGAEEISIADLVCSTNADCPQSPRPQKCKLNKCAPVCAGHGEEIEGECKCDEGYTGSQCDSCFPTYSGYPNCSNCGSLKTGETECAGYILIRCDGQYRKTEDCAAQGKLCGKNGDSGKYECLASSDGDSDSVEAEEEVCEPSCDGKNCGSNGCGGECGNCEEGFACNESVGKCRDKSLCGNNSVDDGELCEIGERKRCSLISAYYVGGEANCLDSCEGFDLSSCETGLTKGFIKVQAGSFWMGSPEGCPAPGGYLGGCQSELGRDADEKLHYVILSRSFEMAKYKTTQKEFFDVMGYASTAFPACGDDCPADACTWHEALAYANAFSAKRGFPQCFDCSGTGASTRCSLKPIYSTPYDCPGFRIPTEAEWEYAVRAGSTTPFYPSQGNDGGITYTEHIPVDPNADQIGWFGGNSSASYEGAFNCGNVFPGGGMCGPQPIGLKDPNAWGFYDMCGNAWEWVFDVYAAYESSDVSKPLVNPVCASGGNSRVTRSGGWGTVAKNLRSANRASSIPEFKSNAYGIRLVRTLP